MDLRQVFPPKRLSMKAAIAALSVGLLIHAWLFLYFQFQLRSVSREFNHLQSRILADAMGDNQYYSGTPEQVAIIEKSPRKRELDRLQERRNRLASRSQFAFAALGVWPIGLGVGIGIVSSRNGRLSDAELREKQSQALVIGALLIALFLLLVKLLQLSTTSFKQWLGFEVIMTLTTVFLLELVWHLIALSRLGSRLQAFRASTRRIPQAAVFAASAFTVSSRVEFGYPDELYSLVAQAVGWSSIVFALGAAAMDYLRQPLTPPYTPTSEATASVATTSEIIGDPVNSLENIQLDSSKPSERSAKSNGKPMRQVQGIVRARAFETRERLLAEVQSLTRRGNLNLTIGSATSLVAAAILWMLVAKAPPEVGSDTFLTYYVPRLSVAIFIEVFSFSF